MPDHSRPAPGSICNGNGHEVIAALEQAPFTRRHGLLLAALLAALVFDYQKPATIGFVIPGMREMWGLTEASAAYLPAAGMGGTVIGSVLWGFMADRVGRRAALLWTVGIFSIATLCGFALAYWQSLLACFVMGFGVGGEIPVVFALASEYLPARLRGTAVLGLGIAGSMGGYALAAGTAAIVKAFYPEVDAWRLLWLVNLIPSVILILALRSRIVPESARYLLAQGRVQDARAAAESLLGPIARTPAITQSWSIDGPRKEAVTSLRTPYGRVAALAFFAFGWGLANFGFLTWLPTLLGRLGYAGATASAYLALSALIGLPSLILTALLFSRWSTQGTLVVYAAGGALALLALGAGASAGTLTPVLLVVASALAFFFIASIGGALPVYAAEVFPTGVRARQTGIVAAAGRLGAIVGPYVGGLWLTGGGSVLGLHGVFAAGLIAAAGVLHMVGVETRGRTLEEITRFHWSSRFLKGGLVMRTIQLGVPTIKCEGCLETIRTALTKRSGVQTVEGDPDRKEVTVTFDPGQLTESEIRAAIAEAGFLVG